MKSVFIAFVLVCCYRCLDSHVIIDNEEVVPTRGQPWPLPQYYVVKDTFFSIDPKNFEFINARTKCDILVQAVKRYISLSFINGCPNISNPESNISFKRHPQSIGQLFNITIEMSASCEKYPYLHMDEQYLLKINDPDMPNKAILYSTSVWGILRGLETFSQLIYSPAPGMFAVNTTSVLDFPRFSHRGMLLDTSRHFIPVHLLLQNLDAMAYSKMNVFHWHIVDDPSFPYVSKTFPQLSEKGAFNPKTHVYTQKDIAFVIEYARLRGIRVLVEFDTPGHTLSWGKGEAKLLTRCYSKVKPIPGRFGPVDPTQNATFDFIRKFFKEISEVFPDDYMHLGGDEVSFDCWQSNPFIQSFMKEHKFGSNYSLLEQYYVQRLLDIVKSLNKSYIVWQEVFDNGVEVKPDTVIHVWKNGYESEMNNVTAAGFKTILSSCWYLNEINYGIDWPTYYACDPLSFNGTSAQEKLVIGGTACMWGEFVDGSNLISRTYPRASVVAERLWSNRTVTNSTEAAPRLSEFRCKMLKRGLKMEPANGPGFCDCDYQL